jgi:hypothetical protein
VCGQEEARNKADPQSAAGMTQVSRGETARASQHDLALGDPPSHQCDVELCCLDRRAMSLTEFGAGRRKEAWEH